jgi:pyruvate, water dikinase
MTPQALEEPTAAVPSGRAAQYVQWFNEIGIDDVPLVGGKNASLGEMYRNLASAGVKVPNGFAITAEAYRHFLRATGVDTKIKDILRDLDTRNIENLRQRGTRVRHAIMSAEIPADLEQFIAEAYAELSAEAAHPLDVAVRSSATAEDLPDASFAGQQETYLNVQGRDALYSTRAGVASPRFLLIARSRIAPTKASTIIRSRSPSVFSAWSAQTLAHRA